MRELTPEEMKCVSGGGAFSQVVGLGFFAVSLTASFFVAGPVGVAVAIGGYVAGAGSSAMYDKMNEGREDQRVENYDAYGNRM